MAIYHSEPNQQPTIGNYLLYGFILVTVVVFVAEQVLQHRAESKRRVFDKNEIHKQNILTVLRIEARNGQVSFEENETKIIHGHWAEANEDYFEMLSHLSSYDNASKLLDESMKYSSEKMHWVESTLKDIEKYLDEHLAKFSSENGLLMSKNYLNTSESYCDIMVFKYMIYSDLMKDPTGKSESQKIEITKKLDVASLVWGYRGVAFGNEKTLEEFLRFIKALKRHWALVSKFEELTHYLNELKENKPLEEFEAKRKSIVRELDKGQKNLKGKCELCPEP